MKRILLVNPDRFLHLPLGLLYISAVLEKDYSVDLCELQDKDISLKASRLIEKANSFKPDFIGFSFMTSQADKAYRLIEAIKKIKLDLPVICGGPHPTFMPKEVLSKGADFVIAGEGERVFPILLDTLTKKKDVKYLENTDGIVFKRDGKIINESKAAFIEDLDTLPMPAYHLLSPKDNRFLKRRYTIRGFWLRVAPIGTSRGCPAKCTFCCNHIFAGRKVRERSVDLIISEIEYLKNRYAIEAFWIIDDTFAARTSRVLEFCSKLKKSGLRLKWACHARCNTFNEKMALAMKDAGCIMVDFGVESGSQKVLDAMKKGTKVEQIYRSFEVCHRVGIKSLANVMIGSPEETWEDIEKTRKVLRDIHPFVVMPSFTTPFPGSILYDLAIKNKWIDEEKSIQWETHNEPSMFINFSREELFKIYELIYKEHRLIMQYALNPQFIIDIVKFFISRPGTAMKIMYYLASFKEHKIKNIIANEFI